MSVRKFIATISRSSNVISIDYYTRYTTLAHYKFATYNIIIFFNPILTKLYSATRVFLFFIVGIDFHFFTREHTLEIHGIDRRIKIMMLARVDIRLILYALALLCLLLQKNLANIKFDFNFDA